MEPHEEYAEQIRQLYWRDMDGEHKKMTQCAIIHIQGLINIAHAIKPYSYLEHVYNGMCVNLAKAQDYLRKKEKEA